MKVEKKKKKEKKDKKDKKDKDKKDKKEKGEPTKTVLMLSGCEDHQVSADVVLEGSATGAMSFSFITALTQHSMDISYADLLFEIKAILKARVKNQQYPLLTTNLPNFDFDQKFVA